MDIADMNEEERAKKKEEILQHLRDNILHLRANCKPPMKQHQVATKLGISRMHMSNIETGKYNISIPQLIDLGFAHGKEVIIIFR